LFIRKKGIYYWRFSSRLPVLHVHSQHRR
jgi:hypothetical protein